MERVLVVVSGGRVTNVFTTGGVECTVVDMDTCKIDFDNTVELSRSTFAGKRVAFINEVTNEHES